MARTFIRQSDQIKKSDIYDDGLAPSQVAFESSAVSVEDDLNSIRSSLNTILTGRSGKWYDDLNTPSGIDAGSQRSLNQINEELHALERKRLLVHSHKVTDIVVPAGQNFYILGSGELPGNTVAAVGPVVTLGSVGAWSGGLFGQHILDEVAGVLPVKPKNLVMVVDGDTRDVLYSNGKIVHALLQFENSADGHAISSSSPHRAQISFVRVNASGDDLEAVPVSDIENKKVNLSFIERKAIIDLNEADFLGGGIVDLQEAATVTRQQAYDEQGVTPVDLTTNAILDLEGDGVTFKFRSDLEEDLFRIVEGSASSTSSIYVDQDVDSFNVEASVNTITNRVDAGVVSVGATAGTLNSSGASDLVVLGGQHLKLDDGNRVGSTWSSGVSVSDSMSEWDAYETEFGSEVSILSAVTQAAQSGGRTHKVYADVTTQIAADSDVGGASGGLNLSDQLPDLSVGEFEQNHDLFLNGELMRPASSSSGGSSGGGSGGGESGGGESGGGESGGGESGGGGTEQPQTEYDQDFDSVSLLLSMDTDFSDSSVNNHAVTVVGNASISTAESKFGGGSGYFDGDDYLIGPTLSLGTQDFTMEAWIKRGGTDTSKFYLFNLGGLSTGSYAFYVQDGYIENVIYGMSGGFSSSNIDVTAGVWTHVATVRQEGTLYTYVNGILVQTVANAGTSIASDTLKIGGALWNQYADYVGGYIDDVRITVGVARYTANFTPPTQAHFSSGPNYGGDKNYDDVSVLLNLDSDFSDSSTNALSVTTVGDVAIGSAQKKYGQSSAFFDGNGDYLVYSSSSATNLHNKDWTVECWFNAETVTGRKGIFQTYEGDTSNNGNGPWNPYYAIEIDSNNKINVNRNLANVNAVATYVPGQWHHIAMVRTHSDGLLKTYFDGNRIDSVSSNAPNINLTFALGILSNWSNYTAYFHGYIDDFRLSQGVARYLYNFTPPDSHPTSGATQPTEDQYYYNNSLLLSMDSDFTDSSVNSHVVTIGGNAAISTTESKFGGGSGYFDGSSGTGVSFASSDQFDLRNVDWTMEAWIKPDGDYSTYRTIAAKRDNTGNIDYELYLSITTGQIKFYEQGGTIDAGVAPVANQWSHVAVARKDGLITIYVNGEAKASATRNVSSYSNNPLGVGNVGTLNVYPFSGYIDDVRITKGVARYTGNFTPPTYAHLTAGPSRITADNLYVYLDAGDTKSYIGYGPTWSDLSGNGYNGNVLNGTAYSASDGGVLVFDGVDDYVNLGSIMNLSTFSISLAVKPGATQVTSADIFDNNHDAVNNFTLQQTGDNTNTYVFGVLSSVTTSEFYLSSDSWHILTFCYTSGSSLQAYKNGEIFFESNSIGNISYSNPNLILGAHYSIGRHWTGQMGFFRIYSKHLEPSEVLQNFNATKDRFGL